MLRLIYKQKTPFGIATTKGVQNLFVFISVSSKDTGMMTCKTW